MTELFENIRLSLADPQTRHAMLVHFPIAFSVLAIPFTLVLPFLYRRRALAYRLLLATAIFATGARQLMEPATEDNPAFLGIFARPENVTADVIGLLALFIIATVGLVSTVGLLALVEFKGKQ